MPIRRYLKRAIDACFLAAVAPLAILCALEKKRGGTALFVMGAQACSLVPGLPGVFLRRAFYRLTLEACGESFFVGFGAWFSQRSSRIDEDAYVGPHAVLGSCHLGRGALVGTRCSILSGGGLHALDSNGRWAPADMRRMQTIHIGEYAWLGESSIVLADVGSSAMVVAGAVVSAAVPPSVVVAGNPARFVRCLTPPTPTEQEHHASATAVSLS
jgi:acetyltransferase-like isoleucine patch superfamily enzyme